MCVDSAAFELCNWRVEMCARPCSLSSGASIESAMQSLMDLKLTTHATARGAALERGLRVLQRCRRAWHMQASLSLVWRWPLWALRRAASGCNEH